MGREAEQLACDYLFVHQDIVKNVTTAMPSEDVLFDLSELYKVFGDSTRIRILYCLFASEMCVCDIATLLSMTQSAISHQLSVLKKSKLIKNRRDGKTIFYSLADSHVRTILDQGVEHVTES
ncbi:MAG: metalloregulator ArsR/SmtB family transcription factor [Clostridia bacterium]